jgi:hypothetical protein
MKVLSAKVRDGHLDIPSGTFREGDTVTVLVSEDEDSGFEVSAREREALEEAMGQARRGETVDGWRLLDDLAD